MSPDIDAIRDRLLVIIPAYNEAACISAVVTEVRAAGFANVVVVDDGSADDTASLAAAAGARVVRLPINLGVGGALRTGFRYAVDHGHDLVAQVDADGQHDARHLDQLLRSLVEHDLDMVIGSRFADGGTHEMSALRRSCIKVMAAMIATGGHTPLTDPTSGFRVIRSPLLNAFALEFPHHYLGDTFEALFVAARRGYRVGEVPVSMRQRQGGRPSADFLASVRSLVRAVAVLLTGTTFDLLPRSSSAP